MSFKIETWFRKNWTKYDIDFIRQFILGHYNQLSESFLREFKDIFRTEDIIAHSEIKVDFARELIGKDNENIYLIRSRDWTEKNVEEFKKNINWCEIFEHNFNIREEFIDKWKDKVNYIDIVRERRYENMKWDPEWRKLVNEEIEQAEEMGLFG